MKRATTRSAVLGRPSPLLTSSQIAGGAPKVPAGGWLRAAREARGLTQREAARRAKVSQQAFHQFETGELSETITLDRLRRSAAAVDCQLVYFLFPKGDWLPAEKPALAQREAPEPPPAPRGMPSYQDEELPVSLL